jgi:hypothetical protein
MGWLRICLKFERYQPREVRVKAYSEEFARESKFCVKLRLVTRKAGSLAWSDESSLRVN